MMKSRGTHDHASVTFTLDPAIAASRASVCGEWNDWSSDAHPMTPSSSGGFSVTVELPAGRAYRFRYLLDGERWENDWAADAYVPNGFGGDDSVVDLTLLAEDVPNAVGEAAAPAAKAARGRSAAKTATAKTAAKAAAKAAKKAEGEADPAPSPKPVKKGSKKSAT
jgi:hypothetical protein